MEEVFKTLPQHTCRWLKDKMTFFKYQGFWNFQDVHKLIISLGDQSYKTDPSDILLCSYPKSGTTWLKALTYAIVTREKFDASTNPLLTTMPHHCVPCLEIDHHKTSDLPVIATHLPYNCLPESIIASKCKFVYIYRDIKDVMVSYYHFMREMVKLPAEDAPFEGAFDEFCQGISIYGPYWDHILGYRKASQENPERFLFLKYEDMKGDATNNVKRLAKFIGYPFSVDEEKASVVENIINLCSFQNLKNLQVNKTGTRWASESYTLENRFYFRKAEDKDWENYFTDDMKEIIDRLIDQKLVDTSLVLR